MSEWEAALLDLAEGWYGEPRFNRLPLSTFDPKGFLPVEVPTQGFAPHEPGGPVDVGDPPLPVAPWIGGGEIQGQVPWIYPVLPGPVGSGQPPVPRPAPRLESVSVEEVTDDDVEEEPIHTPEVDSFEEGDWPRGSIFAPGEVWGPTDDFDPDPEPVPYTATQPHGLDTAPTEDEDMAHDWGHLGRQIIGNVLGTTPENYLGATFGNMTGSSLVDPATSIPSGRAAMPPSGAFRIDQYGRVVRCRRRRRRLLTNSDLKDLAALKTITGNTDALKMAVIKAVR